MKQHNVKIVDVNGKLHHELVESEKNVNDILHEYKVTVNNSAFVSIKGKSIKTDKVVSIEVY